MHNSNRVGDVSFEGWWYIVGLVIALMAVVFFIFLVIKGKGVEGGILDRIAALFGG